MENLKSIAVNSLVFGVVSITLFILSIVLAIVIGLMWYLPVSGVACGVVGLIFFTKAAGRAKAAKVQDWDGKGLNIGGLVCSITGTSLSAIYAIVIIALLVGSHRSEQSNVDWTNIEMHSIWEGLAAYNIRFNHIPQPRRDCRRWSTRRYLETCQKISGVTTLSTLETPQNRSL